MIPKHRRVQSLGDPSLFLNNIPTQSQQTSKLLSENNSQVLEPQISISKKKFSYLPGLQVEELRDREKKSYEFFLKQIGKIQKINKNSIKQSFKGNARLLPSSNDSRSLQSSPLNRIPLGSHIKRRSVQDRNKTKRSEYSPPMTTRVHLSPKIQNFLPSPCENQLKLTHNHQVLTKQHSDKSYLRRDSLPGITKLDIYSQSKRGINALEKELQLDYLKEISDSNLIRPNLVRQNI